MVDKWTPIGVIPDERVLVWDAKTRLVKAARFENGVWEAAAYPGDDQLTDVTHWMPLPGRPSVKRKKREGG